MFYTNDLEQLMQKVDEAGWGMTLLDQNFSELLLARFKQVQELDLLRSATITQEASVSFKTVDNPKVHTIRNDLTYWLDKENHPTEALLLTELEHVLQKIRNYFRISLTHLECHFAYYPEGHFYKKHIDQTKENNKRFFSFVIYLNKNWKETDGGKLVGFENDQKTFQVLPEFGQMIVFKSDIPHEVEVSFNERRSIAGWFRV